MTASGREPWQITVFDDPQGSATRRTVMKLLGQQLTNAIGAQRKANPEAPSPVHVVVPDKATADVLVSIADNLAGIELSREVHRAIEGDAQAVWRRRLSLHASDLVRFGRTYRFWRKRLVPVIESDGKCQGQLLALANRQTADDLATAAGTREVAVATVVSTAPLMLDVSSRRIGDGSRIVLLHVGDHACVEGDGVDVKAQQGSFRLAGLSIGPLAKVDDATCPRSTTSSNTANGFPSPPSRRHDHHTTRVRETGSGSLYRVWIPRVIVYGSLARVVV